METNDNRSFAPLTKECISDNNTAGNLIHNETASKQKTKNTNFIEYTNQYVSNTINVSFGLTKKD